MKSLCKNKLFYNMAFFRSNISLTTPHTHKHTRIIINSRSNCRKKSRWKFVLLVRCVRTHTKTAPAIAATKLIKCFQIPQSRPPIHTLPISLSARRMFNIDREPCLPGCGGSGGVRIFLCAVFHLIFNIFLWRSKSAPLQLQFVLLNRGKDKLERINVFLSSAIYIYLFLYVLADGQLESFWYIQSRVAFIKNLK